jgi:hypothetical protein
MGLPGWHGDFASSPLFSAGLEQLASRFADLGDWPGLDLLNRLAEQFDVRNDGGCPIRFVVQEARCSQRGYENGIHATGAVPTRPDNWHDFFNALIWLAYPRSKAALNACQQVGLEQLSDGRRGPLSDAATLFDESGLVLVAPDDSLATLLRAKQWKTTFWERRDLWRQARVYVIGHSLLEKALAPTPGITGNCLFLKGETHVANTPEALAQLDWAIAECWRSGRITRPADLFPLPVFGIPGYDPGNAVPDFYANIRVFRPPRVARAD